MTLSVALCTCDGERYLDEQMAGLLDQSRPPDEVVVLDDASVDGTLGKVEAMARSAPFPVHVLRNEQRRGPTDSFERAVGACRGSFVALCDQDDRWYPDKLAVLEAALAPPGVLLVFTDGDLIDAQGSRRGLTLWEGVGFRGARQHRFAADPLPVLLNRSVVTGCASAFRRELLDVALPFPAALAEPASPMLHDRWLSLVAACRGEVVAVPDRTLAYRVHAEQVTGIRRRRGRAHLPGLLVEESARSTAAIAAAERATSAQLAALADRLGERGRPIGGAEHAPAELARARRHRARRASLPARRLARLPSIIQGLSGGDYRRYGTGVVSALADLVRPGADDDEGTR